MKFLSTNKATLRGLVPTFLAAFILSCALFSRDLFAKSMLSFLSPSEDIGPVRTGDFVQIVQVKNETDPVSGKTVETKRYLVCMGVKQGDPGNNNGHLQFLTLREIIDYASSQTIPGGTISVPRNFGYESTWWMIHSPIPTNGASRSLTEHGKIIKS